MDLSLRQYLKNGIRPFLAGCQIQQHRVYLNDIVGKTCFRGSNLRLESGTTFNLAISNSASAGNP